MILILIQECFVARGGDEVGALLVGSASRFQYYSYVGLEWSDPFSFVRVYGLVLPTRVFLPPRALYAVGGLLLLLVFFALFLAFSSP